MDFYNKYLKYKEKYLNLKNLLGGGEASARDMFLAGIERNYDGVISILTADRDRGFLRFEGTPVKEQTDIFKNIFEQIYERTNKDKKNIDWIIKSYINNTFGRPSSLENLGRYQDTIKKYNSLKENSDSIKPINEIYGLLDLEDFVDSPLNQAKIMEINEKKAKQKAKSDKEKKVKELGEDDKIVQLETDKVFVYTPTTENGARYYGRNTRWCTAAEGQNMFDYYNGKGQLYIIQSKTDPKLKFQIHIQENQIMNDKDDPVTKDFIKDTFNDDKLNKFLDETIIELYLIEEKKKNKPSLIINNFVISSNYSGTIDNDKIVLDIDSSNTTEEKLRNFFKNFTNVKELSDNGGINQPLSNILDPLINLEKLKLMGFNQPLGNSLTNLINLQRINLFSFNQPLGNSLDNLVKLNYLTLASFNQPLGHSLNNLVKLEYLSLDQFNQPLGNSLDNLVKLEFLELSSLNEPLGNSLDNLVKLNYLGLSSFNEPLGNSLINLINLEWLLLNRFNQSFGNSLDNLIKLETLELGKSFKKDDSFFQLLLNKKLIVNISKIF